MGVRCGGSWLRNWKCPVSFNLLETIPPEAWLFLLVGSCLISIAIGGAWGASIVEPRIVYRTIEKPIVEFVPVNKPTWDEPRSQTICSVCGGPGPKIRY
jgi:hypothetical protein